MHLPSRALSYRLAGWLTVATLLVVAAWYVVVNIAVDILYTASDPRIRLRAS